MSFEQFCELRQKFRDREENLRAEHTRLEQLRDDLFYWAGAAKVAGLNEWQTQIGFPLFRLIARKTIDEDAYAAELNEYLNKLRRKEIS